MLLNLIFTRGWGSRVKRYMFADLFSGCGGLSLGLSLAGLKGRFAIERDAMAFRTFEGNFLHRQDEAVQYDWPVWLEKRAWDIEELLKLHLPELLTLRGTIDVLAGGPPCQGFSFAGQRKEDDPRNLLFNKYVEMVVALQPRALIIENVPGMRVAHARRKVVELQVADPTERAVSFYDKLVESLSAAGYHVHAALVNSAHFGVPQRRSRLIALGVRKDLCKWVDGGIQRAFRLLEEERVAQSKFLGLTSPVTASDAISDLETTSRPLVNCIDPESPRHFLEASYGGPITAYQELMHDDHEGSMDSMRLARHSDEVRNRFIKILQECRKGVRMDDASRLTYGLKKHRIYPMAEGEPAPTVTTLPDDILHYVEPRILTVREYARLQSFPDWFTFRGKYTTGGARRTKECPRYTQVGNAVPPLLARAIGSAVVRLLDEISLAQCDAGKLPARRALAVG